MWLKAIKKINNKLLLVGSEQIQKKSAFANWPVVIPKLGK